MPDRLLSHWPLKLLALGLAFAIWVSVTGEKRIVQDFSLPLEIGLPDDSVLASDRPHTVTVRLRAAESLMRRIGAVPMAIRVDLRDVAPGDHDVQLNVEHLVNLPRGVDVEYIEPDRLSLVLGSRLRRELEVEVTFLGQPPEGSAFYGANTFPSSVLVEGPESQVRPLSVVRTNPIRLDLRTEPFVAQVSIVPEGQFVRVVDPAPVEVRVIVDAAPQDRTFEGVPVVVTGAAEGSRATPDRLDVTLAGPPSIVEAVLPSQLRLEADASGLEPRGRAYEIDVQPQLVEVPQQHLSRLSFKTLSRRKVSVRVSGDNRQ